MISLDARWGVLEPSLVPYAPIALIQNVYGLLAHDHQVLLLRYVICMNDYLVSLLSNVSDPQGLHSLLPATLLLRFLHGDIVIRRSLQAGVLVAFNFKV
jgi:hypothetical protein